MAGYDRIPKRGLKLGDGQAAEQFLEFEQGKGALAQNTKLQVNATTGELEVSVGGQPFGPVGGGLIAEFIDDTFAGPATKGKIYCMGHSAAFGITLDTATDKDNLGFLNTSSANSWATDNVTITPGAGDTIDGDTELILDVDRVWVELYYDAANTNWVTKDPFQPVEAGTGSGGSSAGIDYLVNGKAEGNVTEGTSVIGDGVMNEETTVPLVGARSFRPTVNTTPALQPKFRWELTSADNAFLDKTKLRFSGIVTAPSTGWKIRAVTTSDNLPVPGTDSTLVLGQQNVDFGFVPATGVDYAIELFAETAAGDEACICDNFQWGYFPNGGADLNGWKSYVSGIDGVTISHSSWTLERGICTPKKDPISGRWFLNFIALFDRGSEGGFTSSDFNISGVIFNSNYDTSGQPVTAWITGTDSTNGRQSANAGALPGGNIIRLNTDSTAMKYVGITGYVELDGKPTWADYEPSGVALNNDTIYANVRARYVSAAPDVFADAEYRVLRYATKQYDTHNIYDPNTGIATIPADGEYKFTHKFQIESPAINEFIGTSLKLNNQDATGNDIIDWTWREQTQTIYSPILVSTQMLKAGDQISFHGYQSDTSPGNRTISTSAVGTTMSIERVGSFTSQTTVVADLATADTAGFVSTTRQEFSGRKIIPTTAYGQQVEAGNVADILLNASEKSVFIIGTNTASASVAGIQNGEDGQIVYVSKQDFANNLNIIHNSSAAATGEKILTPTQSSYTITGFGGFILAKQGTFWYVIATTN